MIFARWSAHFCAYPGGALRPGADRRAAHADFPEHPLDGLERAHLVLERLRERLELLAERHGDGILQLRPSHLENVLELLALRAEGLDQLR